MCLLTLCSVREAATPFINALDEGSVYVCSTYHLRPLIDSHLAPDYRMLSGAGPSLSVDSSITNPLAEKLLQAATSALPKSLGVADTDESMGEFISPTTGSSDISAQFDVHARGDTTTSGQAVTPMNVGSADLFGLETMPIQPAEAALPAPAAADDLV